MDKKIIPLVKREVCWYRHALRRENNRERLRGYALLVCDELDEALTAIQELDKAPPSPRVEEAAETWARTR